LWSWGGFGDFGRKRVFSQLPPSICGGFPGNANLKIEVRDVSWWAAHLLVLAGLSLLASKDLRAETDLRSLEGVNLSLRMSDSLRIGESQPGALAFAIPRSTVRDYHIGTEDLLEIQVFGVDQLTRTVRVNSLGQVSLPLIGNLEVGGL